MRTFACHLVIKASLRCGRPTVPGASCSAGRRRLVPPAAPSPRLQHLAGSSSVPGPHHCTPKNLVSHHEDGAAWQAPWQRQQGGRPSPDEGRRSWLHGWPAAASIQPATAGAAPRRWSSCGEEALRREWCHAVGLGAQRGWHCMAIQHVTRAILASRHLLCPAPQGGGGGWRDAAVPGGRPAAAGGEQSGPAALTNGFVAAAVAAAAVATACVYLLPRQALPPVA